MKKTRSIYKKIIREEVDRAIDGEWFAYDHYITDVYLFGIRLFHKDYEQSTRDYIDTESCKKTVGFKK